MQVYLTWPQMTSVSHSIHSVGKSEVSTVKKGFLLDKAKVLYRIWVTSRRDAAILGSLGSHKEDHSPSRPFIKPCIGVITPFTAGRAHPEIQQNNAKYRMEQKWPHNFIYFMTFASVSILSLPVTVISRVLQGIHKCPYC